MKYVLIILLIILNLFNLNSQVNTEKFRRDGYHPGFAAAFGLNIGFNSGNTEYFNIAPHIRLDFDAPGVEAFLLSKYQRKTGNGNTINDEGFAHLRFIFHTNSFIHPEVFTQAEFNKFILLNSRYLAGAGGRVKIFDSFLNQDSSSSLDLHVGIGLMYEAENINTLVQSSTSIFRSTNYISFNISISKQLSFSSINYFQFDASRLKDNRILSESELSVSLSKVVKFTVSAKYRYDNEPPPSIKYYDLEIQNGIKITL